MQPTFPSNSGSQRGKRPFGDPQVEQKSAFLSTGARGAGLGNRVWRKGCSAPTLQPPVYYWEVPSRVQNQGSGLSRKQGRAPRAGPSAAGVLKANAPVTPAPGAASLIQTLVGHHTRLGEVAPARGRKWPAAEPGCPQAGFPRAHPATCLDRAPQPCLRPLPRTLSQSPPDARCQLAGPSGAHAGTRAPSPPRPLTWSCHRSAVTRPIPGPASHGWGGAQGSPRAAAAWGRDCPVAHFLFGRAPTSALAAVAPRDSSGPPPSTRRPVPRRVPTRQSTPKAHALSHASARLGGN